MKRIKRPHRGCTLRVESLEDRRLLAVVPMGFTETVVASNLTSPVTMDIEESGRIWLAYQDGRIEVIENDVLNPQLAHQLDADGSAEHGLQGIELDPNFDSNGYIYVYYTANSPEPHNRLSRLTVDPTTENTILPGSEVVLLDLPNLSDYGNPPWHIGGAVHFALDGTLRLQVGESQQAVLSQDMESPLGKVLRINVDGSVPTDNPFYNAGDGITWRDHIWALGLRNPFAGDLDPVTGQYFVLDVGAGSWEEIDDATNPGLNFGWPSTEGAFNPTPPNSDFTNPYHTYSHSGGDCAITGGAFEHGAPQFPAEYEGQFFFSEFCGGEIRVIDPNNPNDLVVFATGADFPMNIEFAADGSMYYISRGAGAGGAPGIGTGTVRKVQYVVDVPPQIVLNPADTLASVGFDATFTASAAGTTPLSYQWQQFDGASFVDLVGETTETLVVSGVSLADDGAQLHLVVTNAFGSATSTAATLSVTTDTPPTPVIDTPIAGTKYRAGDTIDFSGMATDLEDGTLDAANLTWRVDFHHNVHSHPFVPPTSGVTGGQFTIPTATEKAHDVWFRINLSATDSAGLTTATFLDVFPEKSEFVIETNMPGGGGDITVDYLNTTAPKDITGVVNVERTIEVPASQQVGGTLGFFEQWIDGETSRERAIFTPEDDTAYVALYRGVSGAPVFLSDLPTVGTPPNGWGPMELDTSNGENAAGDGNTITLNGVTYSKGLGVHAYSEVTYDLGSAFSLFVSDIGVDDENDPNGSVVFRVLADGNEVFNSGVMTNASTTQTVDVDVSGVNELKLIVEDGGDGNGSDHADWADARFFTDTGTPIVDINFQLDTAPVPAGYLPDGGDVFGDRGNGWDYGWSTDHTDLSRDRNINADQRLDTLLQFHLGQNWEIALPNGDYVVTASIGDAEFVSTHTLNVEGANYWTSLPLNPNEFAVQSQLVVISDGRLTLDMGAAGEKATRINYLQITASGSGSSNLLPYDSADITLDGHLNQSDLTAFMAGWGGLHGALPPDQLVNNGDLNFDETTDLPDWAILEAAWNTEYGPGSAPDINELVAALQGDFNNDGNTDGVDLSIWELNYGTIGGTIPVGGDANTDGNVTGSDFLTWQRNRGVSSPITAVTEGSENGGVASPAALLVQSTPSAAVAVGVAYQDTSHSLQSTTVLIMPPTWTPEIGSLGGLAKAKHRGTAALPESLHSATFTEAAAERAFETSYAQFHRDRHDVPEALWRLSASHDFVDRNFSRDLAFGEFMDNKIGDRCVSDEDDCRIGLARR